MKFTKIISQLLLMRRDRNSSKNNWCMLAVLVSVVAFVLGMGKLMERSNEEVKQYMFKRKGSKLVDHLTHYLESKIGQHVEINMSVHSLPFCLIVMGKSFEQKRAINASIAKLQYPNFKVIDGGLAPLQKGYQDYQKLVHQNCHQFDTIMFVSSRLQVLSLHYLNTKHQKQKAIMLYEYRNGILEPISFKISVFNMIGTQQAFQINHIYLNSSNWITQRQTQALAIFQLSTLSMKKLQKEKVFFEANQNLSFFWISFKSANSYNWNSYKPLPKPYQRWSQEQDIKN